MTPHGVDCNADRCALGPRRPPLFPARRAPKPKHGTRLTLDTGMPESVWVHTDLTGKVAIITGGAGGIGAVFGRALIYAAVLE